MRSSHPVSFRKIFPRIVLVAVLALMAVPFVYPLIWTALSAFKPASEVFANPPTLWPRNWTLRGVENIFAANPFAQQYANSLYIAAVVTGAVLLISSMAGYAFARIRFRLSNALFLFVISVMFLPGEVTIIPVFRWVAQLGLMDTHWPLIVPPIFAGSALAVFIFRQFFLSLPVELEEAARLDGLGRFGIYRRIALRLAGPAIATVTILTFLASFNQYLEPLVYLRTPEKFTVSIGLLHYQDTYGEPLYNAQLGATALAILPILVVFMFAQRQFVEGLSHTGLKG